MAAEWNKNTNTVYTKIMEVDAGRAGLQMSDTGSLIEHYTPYLTNNILNPEYKEGDSNYEENNPQNIDLENVDWYEILVSCHHMYGYRMDGTPLGIHNMPMDWNP